MERKTVGAISSELLAKIPDTQDPIELEREMHREYEENVFACVEEGKRKYIGDFFIMVELKKERLMSNVLRNYFFSRLTCPTPNYDQTVYHYSRKDDQIKLIWVIPDRETSFMFKNNVLQIVPEEKELLKFVLDFDDGTLFKLCKKLNGEELESPLLEKV